MRVIEHESGHYEVREVPYGKVYDWRPDRVVFECDCGETHVSSGPRSCARAGQSTTMSRKKDSRRRSPPIPGSRTTRSGAGRGRPETCGTSTSSSWRRAMINVAETSPQEAGHREGPSRSWYLIARREGNRLEVLTLAGQPRREIPPLFTTAGRPGTSSSRRCRRGLVGEGVYRRRAGLDPGGGYLPHVDRVVLDPVFGVVAGDAEPQSPSKKEFVSVLLGEPLAAPRAELTGPLYAPRAGVARSR